jgi:hypothetical protein
MAKCNLILTYNTLMGGHNTTLIAAQYDRQDQQGRSSFNELGVMTGWLMFSHQTTHPKTKFSQVSRKWVPYTCI